MGPAIGERRREVELMADLEVVGVARYMELLKDAKVRGYLFEMKNILPGQSS